MERPIVTLTTDFGTEDSYVGTMKGVILGIQPDALLVDITHEVEAYDVLDGAIRIAQAAPYFPEDTIHVVVVDPGVGTARRPLVVRAGKQYYVAPDNGVLTLVYERAPEFTAWHATAQHYFLHPVSRTFHGRDVFAPVAAHLSRTFQPEVFGEAVPDVERLSMPRPEDDAQEIRGTVLHVDRFGNLLTNLTPANAARMFNPSARFRVLVGAAEVKRLVNTFSEGQPGEAVAYVGSSGFLEIGVNRGNAARALGAGRATHVRVSFS
jgi:S-adenosyl-L-methionine hydrolase (adenosine-forming)